jgi:hypothetical protein
MYYSSTELKWLYRQLGAKNKCPVEEANQIDIIYLTTTSQLAHINFFIINCIIYFTKHA